MLDTSIYWLIGGPERTWLGLLSTPGCGYLAAAIIWVLWFYLRRH